MARLPKPKRMFGVMSLSLITRKCQLHAVDSTKGMAEVHRTSVAENYRLRDERARVWIEEFETNHLFASSFEMYSLPPLQSMVKT